MTRGVVKALIAVLGAALLAAVVAILPLHAAPWPQPEILQTTNGVPWGITTTRTAVLTGETFYLKGTVSNPGTITLTAISLRFEPPSSGVVQVKGSLAASESPTLAPGETVTHAIELRAEGTGTLWFSATLHVGGPEPFTEVKYVAVTVSITPGKDAPSIVSPPASPLPQDQTAEVSPAVLVVEPGRDDASESAPTTGLPASITTDLLLIIMACLLLLLFLIVAFTWWMLKKPKRKASPELGPVPVPVDAPSAPVTAHAHLEATGFPEGTQRFTLNPAGFTIGRAEENHLAITRRFPGWDSVSRHHARIHRQGERWVVEDLGSMNGVYVNGRRTGRNLLRDGWRLSVGGVEFIFRSGAGEAGR
jgi:hypothetical protein